jgi:acetyltransferase
LTGSDEVLDAAFRRCGVLRVGRIAELFYMADVLAKQPRPRGPRLTILTNAGGPGVLATDSLMASGGQLAEMSSETRQALDAFLPAAWSRANPIDVLGDADPSRYAKALEVAARDPNSDGLLVVLTPQAMTDPTQTAEALRSYAKVEEKPVLASWMGGPDVAAGEAILRRAGVPTFAFPDTAALMFAYMWRYNYNLRCLYETPSLPSLSENDNAVREAGVLIAGVLDSGRTLCTEYESKRLLAAYGLPTVPTRLATTEDAAIATATAIGYPIVLKLHSETVTHKTDVQGVRLNLTDENEVRNAYRGIERSVLEHAGPGHFLGVAVQPMVKLDGYELIVGGSLDTQFGPVLLFGTGGQLVEVFRDRALALPPLNSTLARRMIEQTRIVEALRGVRGRRPIDMAALEGFLVRFSQLVVEQPRIREIDINPLLTSPNGLLALDARVVLHARDLPDSCLPRPAIRPYPAQYLTTVTLRDGQNVTLRPIRPEDEPLMVAFHNKVSESSVYLRYFHTMKLSTRIAHERLTRICFIDYDREMALVAEGRDAADGVSSIWGIGRLSKIHGRPEAEFSILIADAHQGQGLGRVLLESLLRIGRNEGLHRILADILPDNRVMQRVCQKLGFHLTSDFHAGVVRAEIDLTSSQR